jgi:hypothetical protein
MATANAGAVDDPRGPLEAIVVHLDLEHQAVDFDQFAIDETPADDHRVGSEQAAGNTRILEHLRAAAQFHMLAVETSATCSGEFEHQRRRVEEEREETLVDGTGHARVMRYPG